MTVFDQITITQKDKEKKAAELQIENINLSINNAAVFHDDFTDKSGGDILDLVAKGGQDVYLICNPQMSFFKKVYRRHTNFAVEYQKYELDANLDFGKATTFTLPRKGDLIKNIFLQFHLPELTSPNDVLYSYTNYIGYALIEYIDKVIRNTGMILNGIVSS